MTCLSIGDIRELEARTLECSRGMQKFAVKKMPESKLMRPSYHSIIDRARASLSHHWQVPVTGSGSLVGVAVFLGLGVYGCQHSHTFPFLLFLSQVTIALLEGSFHYGLTLS
jgi:hypothetical protein